MNRLYSEALELAALRSVTCGDDRIVGLLLPRISLDSFSMEHTSEAFLRAQTLMRRHGEMPRWEDLLEDPGIAQDVRDELAHRRVDPVRSRREIDALVKRLDELRRMRVLFKATRLAQERLRSEEGIDLDRLTDELGDVLAGTRGTVDMNEHTTLVGGSKFDKSILREALTNTENEFLPTGIKAFDRENVGVPRGSSWVIAASTGSGKSAVALQVAIHMAKNGAKIVIVSLEMSRVIVIRRILSNLTGIPLQRINQAHLLDDDTRRLLIRAWQKFHEQVRGADGRLRIVAPPEDVSMDEILAMYRPYKYDNITVDYLGLTKGMDAEDQWRKLGSAVRMCTRFASMDNNIITLLCQLSSEGVIRYSRTILEHAHLAWTWTYVDDAVRESRIITIKQPKTRNLKPFTFHVREDFAHMRVIDLEVGYKHVPPGKTSKRPGVGHNGGPPLDEGRNVRRDRGFDPGTEFRM